MFHKILLATDGSEGALHAAQTAADIAGKYAARVTLLYVVTPPMPAMPMLDLPGFNIDPATVIQYAENAGNAVCRATGNVLDSSNVKYDTRVELGHPAESIINVATEGKYDLIVIGSRGLGGVKSFFLGSISDRVAHMAHCPVLIVR